MSPKKDKLSLAKLEDQFFARREILNGDYDLNYCIPINGG